MAAFLNLSLGNTEVLGQRILCPEELPVLHCSWRPLVTHPMGTTRNASRHCQMLPGKARAPQVGNCLMYTGNCPNSDFTQSSPIVLDCFNKNSVKSY